MNILIANLGSTSFKYRLYQMPEAVELARGSIERIGSQESRSMVRIGDYRDEVHRGVSDHAAAVRQCLAQLTDVENGCLKHAGEVAAIGFKAVHGGRLSGVQRIDDEVLAAMSEMNDVAPAHNPPYIAAMRQLSKVDRKNATREAPTPNRVQSRSGEQCFVGEAYFLWLRCVCHRGIANLEQANVSTSATWRPPFSSG